nr:hypothetical protein BDOA9_0105830 [Bradyrhizobium sp. DOA9]
MLTPVCVLPLAAAALPPAAIEEPVRPVAEVDVPPVPTVEADVPPAAAEPPLPPVMLVCASDGEVAASRSATAEVVRSVLMFILFSMASCLRRRGRDRAAVDGDGAGAGGARSARCR